MIDTKEIKIWEIWPGKNRFLCGGRFMIGPKQDLLYYIPCFILLLLIPITFFLFVVPYIWTNVTISLPLISIVIYFVMLFFYFKTTLTEPGIIPRKKIQQIINKKPISDDNFNVNIQKYCGTCEIYKPIRSHHCSTCDNCVEVFDHHCPYLNNCIGGRNYKFFFIFLTNLTLLIMLILTQCFLFIFDDYKAKGPAKDIYIKPNDLVLGTLIIIIIFTSLTGMLCTILLLHHACICFLGLTTKEKIYGNTKNSKNYFCYSKPSNFDHTMILSNEQHNIFLSKDVEIELSENSVSI